MESTRPIRALTRGFDALTVLNSRNGVTVSEVAAETRLPRTTAYRILETLCDSGFAVRDPADERYRLTAQVQGLSRGFHDEAWVRDIASPAILALCSDIVWPVSLATRAGNAMMIRETTDHATPLTLERYSAGCRLPMLESAAGQTFLAFCPGAERESILNVLAPSKATEHHAARPERAELERQLSEWRSQGWATVTLRGRSVEEASIGVPIALPAQSPAVLTARFPASTGPQTSDLERFLPKLHQCSAKISTACAELVRGARMSVAPAAIV